MTIHKNAVNIPCKISAARLRHIVKKISNKQWNTFAVVQTDNSQAVIHSDTRL